MPVKNQCFSGESERPFNILPRQVPLNLWIGENVSLVIIIHKIIGTGLHINCQRNDYDNNEGNEGFKLNFLCNEKSVILSEFHDNVFPKIKFRLIYHELAVN